MNYLKSLFFNFLTVFFANQLLPGIEVVNTSKLPHIGGDILFPLALGLLNSLIYPILRLIDQRVSFVRLGLISFILNFSSYALLKLLPISIQISSVEGYLFASVTVSVFSFLINYLEMNAHQHGHPKQQEVIEVPPEVTKNPQDPPL
ncbi:MAG: phage holin family protein [Verrucomicrobiota bacterium]|nr:phage holin family protein [Verrucomicrobiota bacterium]